MDNVLEFLRSEAYSRLPPDEKLMHLSRALRRLHEINDQQVERRLHNEREQTEDPPS